MHSSSIADATGRGSLAGVLESLESQLDRLERRVHKLEHRLGGLPLDLLLRANPMDLRNVSARIRARLDGLEARLGAGVQPRPRRRPSEPRPRRAASRPRKRPAASWPRTAA